MTAANERDVVAGAAAFLRQRLGADRCAALRLGLVLGSGLKGFAAEVQRAVEVPFTAIPGWPAPHVEGHGSSLVVGEVGGTPVACLSGRVHLYEGWQPREVVRAVRTLRTVGVPAFLLTNAAGGIGDDLSAGDLMAIRDHLNLTGSSPLVGPHEPAFGPRFPDQTNVWSPRLRALLGSCGAPLRPGVYAGLLGPSYETPAEVCMLKALGVDAAGHVLERPVEQLQPREARGIGDAGDRLDGAVDLELVRLDLLLADAAGVGAVHHQALDRVEQVRHLGEVALGGGDDRARALAVVDRLADALDLGAQALADDQARGIIGAAVDAESGGKALQAGREVGVRAAEVVLRDERRNVRIDASHGNPP